MNNFIQKIYFVVPEICFTRVDSTNLCFKGQAYKKNHFFA